MYKFLAVFISFVFAVSSYSENIKNINSIMLIGNSFFYYNNSLHNHLGDLYDADPDLDITEEVIAYLDNALTEKSE